MIKKYRYDGDRKFKLSKVETDETSLEPDRKKAEAKMQKNFEEIQELQKKPYPLIRRQLPQTSVPGFRKSLMIFSSPTVFQNC